MKISFTTFLVFTLSTLSSSADLIFSETFDYPDGTALVSTDNWEAHSGSGDITVSGGAITLTDSGTSQDVHADFAAVTEGLIYYSFDASVSSSSTFSTGSDHEYWAHFNASGFSSKVDFQMNGAEGYNIGIATISSSSDHALGLFDYDTTYKVVVGYSFDDDVSSLWVNPSSIRDANAVGATSNVSSISAVAFRQSSASGTPVITFDNLIVATDFETAAGLTAVPEISSFALIAGLFGISCAFLRRRR